MQPLVGGQSCRLKFKRIKRPNHFKSKAVGNLKAKVKKIKLKRD
jgi:hypothetical protein